MTCHVNAPYDNSNIKLNHLHKQNIHTCTYTHTHTYTHTLTHTHTHLTTFLLFSFTEVSWNRPRGPVSVSKALEDVSLCVRGMEETFWCRNTQQTAWGTYIRMCAYSFMCFFFRTIYLYSFLTASLPSILPCIFSSHHDHHHDYDYYYDNEQYFRILRIWYWVTDIEQLILSYKSYTRAIIR